MGQRDKDTDRRSADGSQKPGEKFAVFDFFHFAVVRAGKQDGEYIEYDNATCVYGELYSAEERVVQFKIDPCRGKQDE